jgi:hypothetical protein
LMPTSEARRKLFGHGSSARDFEKQFPGKHAKTKNGRKGSAKRQIGKRENYRRDLCSASLRVSVICAKVFEIV